MHLKSNNLPGLHIIWQTYQREDVEEALIWERDFSHFFDLPNNIRHIAHHGFTEISNNAHDHSDRKEVNIVMSVKDAILSILIADDGIGIFKKIRKHWICLIPGQTARCKI